MTFVVHLTMTPWAYLLLAGVVVLAVGWCVEELAVRRSHLRLLAVGNRIFDASAVALIALAVVALLRLGFLW